MSFSDPTPRPTSAVTPGAGDNEQPEEVGKTAGQKRTTPQGAPIRTARKGPRVGLGDIEKPSRHGENGG
jgi:hypothetical protein